MFRDLYEFIRDFIKAIITSRLFILGVAFLGMFAFLIIHLFKLQIIEGETYLNDYKIRTKATISTQSTRGNIYDRKGKLLAYNELAYSITVTDTGEYKDKADMNKMILELIHLLKKHNVALINDFKIAIDQNGNFVYTTSSENERKRFLRDIYGRKSINELDDKNGKYPSDISAKDVFDLMAGAKRYKLVLSGDKDGNTLTSANSILGIKDSNGDVVQLSNQEALDIISVRFSLASIAYKSYQSITVASNIDNETVADILENATDLKGVQIEEETLRKYNDSIYFAQVIGYTGIANEEELAALKTQNPQYALNDKVGKIGLEREMELELQGTKGSQTMFLDSMQHILEITESIDPVAGNDIYLTMDRDLQVGIYQLIENQLAGVLAAKIKNKDIIITKETDSSAMEIPVKKAYYHLIRNNVLSYSKFALPEASEIEKQIYSKFSIRQTNSVNNIRVQLTTGPIPFKQLSEEMQVYMQATYKSLSNKLGIIVSDNIDKNDSVYKDWIAGTISLREFLYYGLSNNWIDATKLSVDEKYSNVDDVYNSLVEYICEKIVSDVDFSKSVYNYLIQDGTLTGKELCLALFEQGVLAWDDTAIAALNANGNNYAYSFFMSKISNIEITPAQLALDPCSGFCVVTDVKTGEVLAMVSYPSYDNNNFTGAYYNQLNNDLSLPLYNSATKVKTAPGSTFKPLSAIIGLEEGTVSINETIVDTGLFDAIVPSIKCWIYPNNHGALNVVGALRHSCNYYFNEVGYRLSTDSSGTYNESLGVSKIQKYAALFGLNRKSGVEVEEADPSVTDKEPVPSMIGQGSNSFTCIQLARYITTIANSGNVFDLSILNKLTDVNGKLITDYAPKATDTLDFKNSTWNAVHQGMREVITSGSVKDIFQDLEIPIAGKTGTAQQDPTRANHSLFVSYGPYDNPEISVAVQIPFGYTSANAAEITKEVYKLYYEYTELDSIIEGGAANITNINVRE